MPNGLIYTWSDEFLQAGKRGFRATSLVLQPGAWPRPCVEKPAPWKKALLT
jgi:hypothetical protein